MLEELINDPKILNIYQYGSRLYGCYTNKSDYDYLVVLDKDCTNEDIYKLDNKYNQGNTNINVICYIEHKFIKQIREHEIIGLECIFSDKSFVIKETNKYGFNLKLDQLRESISQKSSNSFVKCKKKLTVAKDYNPYIGKKSLFHSLRIILFGIQIAEYGRIVDYTEANKYFNDIMNMPDNWDLLKEKYQPIYNHLKTEFRKLTPKQ